MTHLEPREEHLTAMCLTAAQYRFLQTLADGEPQSNDVSDKELRDLLQRNLIERHRKEIYITPLGTGFARAMRDLLNNVKTG